MTMNFKIQHLLKKIDKSEPTQEDFNDVYRRKTKLELILISLVVFGIEICYAAETAFVSPILQKIGIPIEYTSLIWGLSPIVGFFTCPIFGSLSDDCHSRLGRRRPFIILYSIGILLGLILTGYGHIIGNLFSDSYGINPLVITLTIIGVVLLDFDCDACQSPARAYLIDVSQENDHPVGLSTFTVMAGAGGCIGYILGGIPWNFLSNLTKKTESNIFYNKSWTNQTEIIPQNDIAHSHKQILFTIVAIIYVICALLSITSFKEIPLKSLNPQKNLKMDKSIDIFDDDDDEKSIVSYEDIKSLDRMPIIQTSDYDKEKTKMLKIYLKSIIKMPISLMWLCLTHLFCWMALLCYSLYFTDFVGEEVFGGIPSYKVKDLESNQKYDRGVRIGSFCMALYSLSCSFYSLYLEKFIFKFNTKKVYTFSQLIYSFGMLLLGMSKSKLMIAIASLTAGVMYSCLFTIPFILVAKYHTKESFELLSDETQTRGLGTDISIVSSMVFVAQFFLSSFIGFLIKLVGTKTVVIFASSIFSLCATFTSQKILYFD